MSVELGETYRDKIHGIKGVATAATEYLTGCTRILLEKIKDDTIVEYWIDETRLEGCGLPEPEPKDGGPGAIPPSRDPTR